MKRGFIFLIIIAIAIFIFVIFSKKDEVKTSTQISEVSPIPKTSQIDSFADLEQELESVDPKVLDSDFDE